MDPGWDHTENEDKLLLAHASRMGQDMDTVIYSSDDVTSVPGIGCSNNKLSTGHKLISLSSEYINFFSSVVMNSVNIHAKQQLHDPFNIFSCYILFYSYIFLLTCKCSLFYSFCLNIFCFNRPVMSKFLNCSTKSNIIELLVVYYFLDGYKKGPLSVGNSRLLSKLIKRSSEFILCCNAHLSIIESNLVITSLSEYLYRCIEILEILNIGTMCCCCVCCFKCNENKNELKETFNLYRTFINPHYYETAIMSFYNQGNHLCLCLIVNYVLANCIRLCICYLRDIEMDIISVIYKNYDKYTHSTTYMFSVGKLIILLIKVIHKITVWMKLNYLCTCIPGCPCCCPTKGGTCTCQCKVCSQPPVTCCTCPKQPQCNNGNGANNCCCKCSQKNGQPCSSCCSGRCREGKCCRCCCNCFCKNYEDPWYPYLISIILYVSSLIENIWSMDIESVRMAIDNLSSLYSQLESYDLSSVKDRKKLGCNSLYTLLVDKQWQDKGTCPCKQGEKCCCCWCVSIVNLIIMLIYLCIQCKLCKAICNNSGSICDKVKEFCNTEQCKCTCQQKNGLCCLLKLALSYVVGCSEELTKTLQDCCNACTQRNGCCKTLLAKVKSGLCKLLLLGCCCKGDKCGCESKSEGDVKFKCLFFNNPYSDKSVALVVFCKCKEHKGCCCLYNIVEKLESKLSKICQSDKCVCEDLQNVCKDLCCGTGCTQCVCKKLQESLKTICNGDASNCLCKLIKECLEKCLQGKCQCKDKEGCCRCVCCKIVAQGVRILTRACRSNVVEPYKRIVMELLSCSKDKNDVIRTIVEGINRTTLNNMYLVKNSYSSCPESIGSYADTINGVTNVETRNWGYDRKYEHDVTNDKGFRRGDDCPNLLSDPRYTFSHLHKFPDVPLTKVRVIQ